MTERVQHAKQLHNAIRQILLEEWDPIGVADVPEAQDEYDSYVPQTYGMLIRREPTHKLFDFLWWVETDHMALCGNRIHTEAIANRLAHLAGDASSAS